MLRPAQGGDVKLCSFHYITVTRTGVGRQCDDVVFCERRMFHTVLVLGELSEQIYNSFSNRSSPARREEFGVQTH